MWIQADCRHLAVRPLPLTRDDPPVVHTNCPTPHIHKGYISIIIIIIIVMKMKTWYSLIMITDHNFFKQMKLMSCLFVRYEQAKVDTFIAETEWHFHLGLIYDQDSQVVMMMMMLNMMMMMMMMMMMTDVRLCCKGLLGKYEPISGGSQVPVDNPLRSIFPCWWSNKIKILSILQDIQHDKLLEF